MSKEEKIIHYDSQEAAQFQTGLSGWVDRYGRFWGNDEHMARWSGCTHLNCTKCGEQIEVRSYCRSCSHKTDVERYLSMPKQEWYGEEYLYSMSYDKYIYSNEELFDFLAETNTSPEDLMLVICEPNYLSQINSDYWCDDLTEDGDLPGNVESALEALNKAIRDAGPASYSPGNKAAIITMDKSL